MKRLDIEEMKEVKAGAGCPPGTSCMGGLCLEHLAEELWYIRGLCGSN